MTDEFQTRRREHTTSEETSDKIIQHLISELQKKIPKLRAEEIARRKKMEDAEFQCHKQTTEWTDNEKYGRGRISGSYAWKQSRHETGNQRNSSVDNNKMGRREIAGFDVEAFFPPLVDGGKVTFQLHPNPSSRHDGIVVSHTACAVGESNSISVVVVDDKAFGCILQSKSFVSWPELVNFVDTLPADRLVLMNGKIEIGREMKPEDFYRDVSIDRLGGWNGKEVAKKGVLFMGQVGSHPDWTFFSTIDDSDVGDGYEIEIEQPVQTGSRAPSQRLRTERATIPLRVAGRLPEAFMPLRTQTQASDEQKWEAFDSFLESHSGRYCGYTSKSSCPIYLLDSSSYPLQRMDKTIVKLVGKDNVWNTFLSLPEAIVPKDDFGLHYNAAKTSKPWLMLTLECKLPIFWRMLGW